MFWKCLKRIKIKSSCVSNCSFNNQEFKQEHLNRNLNDYILKNKDIETILKILSKRNLRKIETQI